MEFGGPMTVTKISNSEVSDFVKLAKRKEALAKKHMEDSAAALKELKSGGALKTAVDAVVAK